MNSKTKRTINDCSKLLWVSIKPIKVRSVKKLARFNSKYNDLNIQFMSRINCLEDQSDL